MSGSTAPLVLIGLTGRAHTGKDTAANYLCSQYGFEPASFAETLKLMLETMFNEVGIDYAHLYEPHLKNEIIPELGTSARHLMQSLGTEWGRQCHGADFWVRLLAMRLGLHDLPHSAPVHDRLVITDVRFANECAWVRGLGGQVLRLWREQAGAVRAHASEAEVDQLHADVDLFNNGSTLDGFHALLDGAMAGMGVDRRESSLTGPF